MSGAGGGLSGFGGTVRLFPLPNLVLFPHVVQPLHIFEPRYRQLTRDALDADRLLAMAFLQPGWKKDYKCQPPLYPGVYVCKIVADQVQPDGRYNLLVRGLARAKISHESEPDKLYRQARVELLPGVPVKNPQTAMQFRQRM